jgi:DNA-binding SARP family transcriptional activator
MSVKERIKSLVKEAELYRSQSLLKQSKEKYLQLLHMAEKHEQISKDIKFINSVKQRIKAVEEELAEVDADEEVPELSENVQTLISNLFSFSKNKTTAAIEGAVALAKFGQFDKAVKELQRLIKEGSMPLQAAMNLLRCHLSLGSPEDAVTQFKRWESRNELGKGDLKYLRHFLSESLEKKGLKTDLQDLPDSDAVKADEKEPAEDLIDLSSISVKLVDGPRKGETVGFDVTFQSGNTVSLIIPARQKDIADAFKSGLALPYIQCCSPLAVFNGKGIVSEKTTISSGPKRGDYSIDITIHEDGA